MQKLNKNLFQKALYKAGIQNQVHASQALVLFNNCMEKRWGSEVAKDAQPLYVKNEVLMVKIQNPSLTQEIRLSEETILSEINKRLENEEIKRINFKFIKKNKLI